MANTRNQRIKQPFRRQTGLTYQSPLKGVFVRNALEHSQGALATGRYHFSVWFAGRQITIPFTLTDKGYYTKVIPGPNETYLQFVFLVQPATDECTLQVCGETSDEKEIPGGYEDTFGLMALQEIVFLYQATNGVETDIYFNVDADYVVRGMTVRDLPLEALTSEESGYYDLSNYYAGSPISAEIVQKVVECQEDILEDIRKVHVNQAPLKDDEPLLSCTPTTSWSNLLDITEIDYDADSPGFWIRPGAAYLGNRHVQLKCRVKAASASGTAILRFIGNDYQYSDEIAVTSGTATWYTVYFFVQTPYSYQAEYAEKIDLQCKDASTMNLDIYNILVEEMDTQITSVDCFRAIDTDSILPSIDNLPAAITINDTIVYPTARYRGKDATVSSWPPWGYGETLTIFGSGADPTPNNGSLLLGTNDDSVLFNEGKCYQGPDNDYLNFGTKDFIIEGLINIRDISTDQYILTNFVGNLGYFISFTSGVLYFRIGDGTNFVVSAYNVNDYSIIYFVWIVDRSGSQRIYINGTVCDTDSVTSVIGSISLADEIIIGAHIYGAAAKSKSAFEYFAFYEGQDWLDTHVQDDLVAERFSRLCGTYPQIARGTAMPLSCTRNSVAMLRKYTGSATKLYRVDANWPRIEYVKDGSDDDFKGYLSEPSAENKCLQSEDMSTTWAKVNAGDTIDTDATAGPDGETSLDGIVADATDTQHGFSQSITLTAASWVFSKFLKAGDRTWGYLDVSTITNAYAYFNLSSGAVGTVGAAATAGIEDYGGGLYRCWITYTGTAAAHTHRSLAADADADNSIVGDASTTNIYQGYAQVELGTYPTSYIQTTTAAITRAADRLYYDGDDGNAGDEHGTIECTVLARDAAPASVKNLVTLSAAGSADNKISYRINTSQQVEAYVRDAAADQVSSAGSTDVCDDDPHIHRLRYKVNSVWSLLDGSQEIAEDSSCTMPTIDRIDIGADEGGTNQAGPDVWIKKVRMKRISTSH